MIEAAIKERPILFSGSMVRAVLQDRKTQTRRVIKLPSWSTGDWIDFETDGKTAEVICAKTGCPATFTCPYGNVGDRLWVRETWRTKGDRALSECAIAADIMYAATADESDFAIFKWKPSIHIPRWASRLTLEITEIRIQQLQDISEEDAIAEGIEQTHQFDGYSYYRDYIHGGGDLKPTESFRSLWNSINDDRGYAYELNPWVWAVSFKATGGG